MASKKQVKHSAEYNVVIGLCKKYNKDLYARVLHPVRKEMMMLYSIMNDLMSTYGWMPSRIEEWVKFI